jgi:long-subunit fatty acid transport protein
VFGDLCKALGVSAADITSTAFGKAQANRAITINPAALSEDEKVDIAMRDFEKARMGKEEVKLAALRDENKKRESEHFADEGA